MTKRISQANTVVVPAVHADGVDGKVVATKTVVVPAEAEVAAAKAEVKTDEAPATVVADPVAALVAPAPMAMVAEQTTTAEPAPASASASSMQDDGGDGTDLTPYIVGGALILGGVLAVALSSGDTDPIAVTPAPANTAPTFTSAAAFTFAENQPAATVFYDANAADTQGNAIVFSIGGTDAALFTIDPSTGVVLLRTSANFEAKSTYSFTVTATDNGTPPLSTTQTITATITNVNETPTFTSATATASVPENIPTTQVVFTASATDPDVLTPPQSPLPAGAAVTYAISGADAAFFNINAANGQVTFRASPDFETRSSYTFVVTASDNGATPLSSSQTVTITVTDVAEGPTFTSGATATVAENSATTTVVYDANTAGAATFALTGADAGAFNIDTATGVVTLRAPADFETKATYNINVVATGAGGATTQAVVVGVTNVNETPTFNPTARVLQLAENVPAGTVIQPLAGSVVDPDGAAAPNTLTYSITGADTALFSVNATNGFITLTGSPNFEAKPSYSINLVATDQGGLSASQAITLNITNVNETPTFAAATATATVAENGTANSVVYTGTATDPDAGAVLTYSLSGTDAGAFTINAATGAVTLTGSANFEAKPSYMFNVVATDQGGLAATQAVTLNVTNVNEAPTFAAGARTTMVAENVAAGSTVFATGGATDVDAGATITYTLTGADAAAFAVNAQTGAVTFVGSPNFETKPSYTFNLVATDQGGLTATQANTVTITNVNEAPTVTVPTTPVSFAENQAAATAVFTAVGTDPDAGTTLSYSLTGADAARFAVSSTGVVTFVNSPNFETAQTSFTVAVVVTDGVNPAVTSSPVTVNVTNVNETPTFPVATRTAALNENVAAGTAVPVTVAGSATATDPDGTAAPNTLTYRLTGADAAAFSISAAGAVTINASPDFETKATYSFNVVATDQGGLAATQAVTLNINDLPEGVRIDGAGISATTNASYSAANGNVTFLESGNVGNISTIATFASGDIILTDVATSSYSFSSDNTTLIITLNNGGVVTTINLPNAISAGAFVFNEASAESAVGFDFFRSSLPPAQPASGSLDENGNTATTFDAGTSANTYTDNGAVASNAIINNFTADDRIVVTNAAAGSYSFTSDDNDLFISFNNGGVVSVIRVNDVVSPNANIFDETSAEAAVGFDFFRYG